MCRILKGSLDEYRWVTASHPLDVRKWASGNAYAIAHIWSRRTKTQLKDDGVRTIMFSHSWCRFKICRYNVSIIAFLWNVLFIRHSSLVIWTALEYTALFNISMSMSWGWGWGWLWVNRIDLFGTEGYSCCVYSSPTSKYGIRVWMCSAILCPALWRDPRTKRYIPYWVYFLWMSPGLFLRIGWGNWYVLLCKLGTIRDLFY